MLILKGIIIGIGKIIPGVSGSMLAISMGIYQRLIDSINNFFKDTKNNFKFLLKIGIGIIIAIVFFSKLITSCLNKYYLITMFFFIGLIIGSLNDIKININKKNNYILIISFLVVTILGIININNEVNYENDFLNFIFFIFVGVVDAFTMVIPGISGTATLMMIGAYNRLMETFSNILNIDMFYNNVLILFPYVIGMILGIIVTVKLVDYLFHNLKSKTYSGIMGFSLSTIILMGIRCFNTNYSLKSLLVAFFFLLIGIFITKSINKKE